MAPSRFALKFLIGFALLTTAFEASRGTPFERFVVERLILAPTTALIKIATPQDGARLLGRTIASAGANLHVTRGCEGVEMFLLLTAGILAYPTSWQRRATGLLLGCALAYGLSIGRLLALYYVLHDSPGGWGALHGLILPLAPILLIALYFARWSRSTTPLQQHAA
jgi:exosortase/archaeosortase family protein